MDRTLAKGETPVGYEIYILTTKSGTCFSKLIHIATSAPYTHVSIGLDGLHGDFYSFARKYRLLMLPAGLIKEEVDYRGSAQVPYQMYRLQVSESTYLRLRRYLEEMYDHRECYRYNILGVITAFFHFPLNRRGSYFCSQFVAEALEACGALELGKNTALVHPVDFCGIDQLQLVSEGTLGGFGADKALPRPSEVAAVLPFGPLLLRAYRFCAHHI